ncbi:MAG TPA: hypothetical protein GX506_01950 [Firmicutes bacterium]|nr:hypothetical protein [Bacillota bacterium]
MPNQKTSKPRVLRRRSLRKSATKPIDVDDKDFLDMIMAEVNEEEAAEVLGEPAKLPWSEEQEPQEPDEKE